MDETRSFVGGEDKARAQAALAGEARLKLAPGWKREKLRAVAVLQAPAGPVSGVAAVALASK